MIPEKRRPVEFQCFMVGLGKIFLPQAVDPECEVNIVAIERVQPDNFINQRRSTLPSAHEDYLDDARGHSCLMLAFVAERPLHVVCAPKDDYLVIITAYLPNDQEWEDNYRKRKKL